jgi:hypothetical protein
VSERRLKAVIATLYTHFRLTPGEVAGLTDRQIVDYYWHRRNRHGEIEIPGWEPVMKAKHEPGTLESDLAAVAMLERTLGNLVAPGSADAARQALREKYAVTPPENPTDGRPS